MECTVRDVNFVYEDVGSGKPLLILHGWPLDHRHVAADMEPVFAGRDGWRRIYPDLPGFGKTRAPDWLAHHDEMIELIGEFIDAVVPGERFVVAGTSFGGYLARGLAHRRGADMDGLLLTVPHFAPSERKETLPEHRVLREDEEFAAALKPGEDCDFVVMQSLELLEDLRRSVFPAIPLHDEVFGARMDGAFSLDLDSSPEPFPAPALVLCGRFDGWCGYREAFRVLDGFPRATYAVLDCAGHALPTEQKALFGALVSNWLDRVEDYAARRDS